MSKFKYYRSTCLEEGTQSPEYPGLFVEISTLNLQYTNQNCCTLDRDVRLRRNEDGEDEGMKERRVRGRIYNVYNIRIILRTAEFPRGRLAAFYSHCCLLTYSFRLDRRDSLYLITVTPQSPYKLHCRIHALSCHPAPPANPAVAFRIHKTRL